MERTNEKPQADGLGATAGTGLGKRRGATVDSVLQNGRHVKPRRFMSLQDWESQWGGERFEFVEDLYPLRFDMPVVDLQALAARVAGLVDAHDSLACHHLQAIARYRRMGAELRRMIDEDGGEVRP